MHIIINAVLSMHSRGGVAARAGKQEAIDGYTPANFISYSDKGEHRCHYMLAVEVDAPVSICYELWNDWCRLVDFLDLVAQVCVQPLCLCLVHRAASLTVNLFTPCRLASIQTTQTAAYSSASTDGVGVVVMIWSRVWGWDFPCSCLSQPAVLHAGHKLTIGPPSTFTAGRMPIMEIVFLAQRTRNEPNKLIQFETVWGLPAAGEQLCLCAAAQ